MHYYNAPFEIREMVSCEHPYYYSNKNDNIHKNKVQKSDDQTNIDKYRSAANITEYHIILKNLN